MKVVGPWEKMIKEKYVRYIWREWLLRSLEGREGVWGGGWLSKSKSPTVKVCLSKEKMTRTLNRYLGMELVIEKLEGR